MVWKVVGVSEHEILHMMHWWMEHQVRREERRRRMWRWRHLHLRMMGEGVWVASHHSESVWMRKEEMGWVWWWREEWVVGEVWMEE